MSSAQLSFGVGRATITPPAGLWLSGFSLRDGPMEGVHDDLYATAIVLSDGTREVTIIGCDLVGLPIEVATAMREEIARRTGIPREAVLLACSHSHAGPATGMLREPQDDVPAYLAALELYIGGAVRMARTTLQPGHLLVARGRTPIGINRRRPSAGTTLMEDNPEGPIDDSVTLVRLVDAEEHTAVTMAHCACHPVSLGHGNRLASADYVGFARDVVEHVTGAPLLFLQGACGDVNPRAGSAATDAHARRTGHLLASEILRLHELAAPAGNTGIAVLNPSVELAMLPPPPRDDVARRVARGDESLRALLEQDTAPGRLNTARFPVDAARDLLAILDAGRAHERVRCEVQALQVGPLALVALPVEPFAATGIAIRDEGSLPYNILVGYANGCLGYLPTPEAYAVGGYEVEAAHQFYRLPLALAPDAEPHVRAIALALLADLASDM